MKKQEVKIIRQIKVCPGKRHAWFEAIIGKEIVVIRKQI